MKFSRKKIILFSIVVVITGFVMLVLTFSDQGFYYHYYYSKKLRELETTIDSLKNVNDSLATEIKLLKSDQQKIESVAREKYGLIKPGEKVYKIQIIEK